MSKTGSAAKVKLNSFDDLFGSSEMQTDRFGTDYQCNRISQNCMISKDHPFSCG